MIRNLNKSHRHYGLEANIIYDLANKEKQSISVYRVLDILGVSRSCNYAWMNREPSKCSKRKKTIQKQIKVECEASKQIFGAPKTTEKLQYMASQSH